jgi:hypothetical protein
VPLLPPLEDDVHEIGLKKYPIYPFYDGDELRHSDTNDELREGFIEGYNKAKEKYKYTQEDILIIRNKLVNMLPTGDVSAWDMIMAVSNYTKWFDEFIQSLQQSKYPVAFECEMVSDIPSKEVMGEFDSRHKTITNSQGQTQLVGTYKYE